VVHPGGLGRGNLDPAARFVHRGPGFDASELGDRLPRSPGSGGVFLARRQVDEVASEGGGNRVRLRLLTRR